MVGFSVQHLYVLSYNVRSFDLNSWTRLRLPRLRSRRDIIIGMPRPSLHLSTNSRFATASQLRYVYE